MGMSEDKHQDAFDDDVKRLFENLPQARITCYDGPSMEGGRQILTADRFTSKGLE